MSFEWKKYIELAEKIVKNNDKEEYLRTAVSRAYYGIFCIARDKKGLTNQSSTIHKRVKDAYLNSNLNSEQEIGRILNLLRRNRNNADYDNTVTISKSLAERCVLKAKYCLNLLNNL